MEKHCKQCGAYMKCLKTGIMMDVDGEGRTGDLFGCPFCGELSLFGINRQAWGLSEYQRQFLHAKVVSHTTEPRVKTYGYDIFHYVRLESTEDFLDFMAEWNLEYFQKNKEKFK